MKKWLFFLFLPFTLAFHSKNCPALTLQPQTISAGGKTVELMVPQGMRVEFLASMEGPRFLTLGPKNELLVGSRGKKIYRLKRPYTRPEKLVSLTGRIHSVAYRDGRIIAAETGGLYSAPYTEPDAKPNPKDFSLVTPLPSRTGGHWSRTVLVGPDKKLYIGIGISGNCSDEYLDNSYPFERKRGGVFLLDESDSSPQLIPYSSGLRNPIGLAFHPETEILYATNAGSDNLGFEQPPEILASLHQGSFHGMPWFQYMEGTFQNGRCATSTPPRSSSEAKPPASTFEARSTPEGVVFAPTGSSLGPDFHNNALVAIHGSWAVPAGGNSSSLRPPKIVMVQFSEGLPASVTDVITGFQRPDGTRFARPCGMLMGADGSLYFTSDGGEVSGLFRLRR